jgi:predicted nucleotidyltransferase
MDIDEILKDKREEILRIAAKHGAYNVRIFGSVARGEASQESDVDFLVDMEPGRSLFDHVALLQDLEELLGMKVDVATEDALHWYIRDQVLSEAIPLPDFKRKIEAILQELGEKP